MFSVTFPAKPPSTMALDRAVEPVGTPGWLVLLIAMTSLTLYLSSWVGVAGAREEAQAGLLADSLLEARRPHAFDGPPGPVPTRASEPFQAALEVRPIDGVDPDFARELVVRIQWTRRGSAHSLVRSCAVSAVRR